MGRATSKGNEAKSRMKQPSDMRPRRDSNTGGSDLWSNTLPLDQGGTPKTYLMSERYHIRF